MIKKYYKLLERYSFSLGLLFWSLIVLHILVFEYRFNLSILAEDLFQAGADVFSTIQKVPVLIYTFLKEFIIQCIEFVVLLWQGKSWGKAGEFLLIGVIKRFIIEDIVMALITQNFLAQFKDSLSVWLKLRWRSFNIVSKKIKFLLYSFFIAPIISILAWSQIGNIIWFWIKKIFINKTLSFLKLLVFKLIPWLMTLIIDSSSILAVLLQYVITMQIFKTIVKIPFIGPTLYRIFSKLIEWVKSLDQTIKKWALRWPKGRLKRLGRKLDQKIESSIISKGYTSTEQASCFLEESAALNAIKENAKKTLFKSIRKSFEKSKVRTKYRVRRAELTTFGFYIIATSKSIFIVILLYYLVI